MTQSNSKRKQNAPATRCPTRLSMETFRTAHEDRRELTAQLKQQEQELADRRTAENAQAEQLQAAERNS